MEVCVDNIQSVINACNGGAIRLELCAALSEGGLTPTIGFLRETKKIAQIPVFIMLRPRTGDFIYTDNEIEIMKTDMEYLKQNGADGFVLGVLTSKGTVNKDLCKEFVKLAAPLPVTFHRAFDYTANPFEALEGIIDVGFKRILTSGQAPTAEKGMGLIKKLIAAADNRITILPGCGINEFNLSEILTETKATEFHGSAKKNINCYTLPKSSLPYVSSTSVIDKIQVTCVIADEEAVRRLVKIAEDIFK